VFITSGTGFNIDAYSEKNYLINNTVFITSGSGFNIDFYSGNNIIAENTIFVTSGNGISIDYGSGNNILTNNVVFIDYGTAINVDDDSDNNLIERNTICTYYGNGININENSEYTTIEQNFINITYGAGINVHYDSGFTKIINNTVISTNATGLYIDRSGSNTIINNTILTPKTNGIFYYFQTGMYFLESGNNVIIDNVLINSSVVILGTQAEHYLQANVTNNSIDGNPLMFYQGISGGTVSTSADGHLILVNCDSVEVTDQNLVGIQVAYSSNIFIHNNNILNSHGFGIYFGKSENSVIFNNTVSNNKIWGIVLGSGSKNITVNSNNVNQNDGHGIYNGNTEDNTFINNDVNHNGGSGIFIIESNDTTLINNTFINNVGPGIEIKFSDNSLIKYNNFYGNNISYSQAFDAGSNNSFVFNFWNDWVSPDSDGDGIVDNPYSIDGSANNFDHSPMVFPNSLIDPNILTKPKVLYPNGGEILAETIRISWIASFDSEEHPVSYSIYYSQDMGNTWILITSGLTNTNFLWDTSSLDIETSYMIKIVAENQKGRITEGISAGSFTLLNIPPNISSTSDIDSTSGKSSPGFMGFFILLSIPFLLKTRKIKGFR
jgi:parallel beta-helix repeat protein